MNKTQYIGKAGQLAIMGELAFRHYNVAIPEMDVGDDVFVVNDKIFQMWRLQVKTATPQAQTASVAYQFSLRADQLSVASSNIDLHYAFVLRARPASSNWWNYLIVPRAALAALSTPPGQRAVPGKVTIRFLVHDDDRVTWKAHDLKRCYNNLDEYCF